MLTRQQVCKLTGWKARRLARLIDQGKVYEDPEDGISPIDVYRMSPKGREALRQLLSMPWYGEWWLKFPRYLDLEAAGLIAIERPVHPTGIQYDIGYWRPVLTELGWEVVRELCDSIEFHGLEQDVTTRYKKEDPK